MAADGFNELLDLEEQFYQDGYQQGLNDGAQSGRIEGRTFGLEQGFEKFKTVARLWGRSIVWANRAPQFQHSKSTSSPPTDAASCGPGRLPPLSENPRLAKHIRSLHVLAESESLSTDNTEEAVSDFDDRLKRAQAKIKMIEQITGEDLRNLDKSLKGSNTNRNIEDASVTNISL